MGDHFEGRTRSDSSDVAMRKIFIGGLSYSTDEEKLKRYFRDYGIVQDAVVMKDPVSKRSRGFGFITFYDSISVDSVLAAEPHLIDGRKVEAKRAVPRSEMTTSTIPGAPGTPLMIGKIGGMLSSPSIDHFKSSPGMTGGADDIGYNKIFVGGLHYDTRDQEFKEYFGRFGRIVHGEVMFNRETHKSRGFGFIVFETADSAIRACDVREHIIDGKVVEVKLAIPRSKIGPATPGNSNGLMSMSNTVSPSTMGRSRTLSASSAQVHSPSITLSGNSSTLAASSGSHKVGPGQLSFATGSNNSSGLNGSLRKPASIGNLGPLGPTPSRALPSSSASYATALRFGNGVADEGALLGSSSTEDNMTISYFEQLVVDSVRPSRAQSEPIVKYDSGNHTFSGDLMNFGSFLHQPPANTPQLPSQNVSRSNSIAIPNGTLNVGNSLSPESNPLANSGFTSGSLAEKLFGDGGESASLFRANSNNNNAHGVSTSGSLSSILFASPTEAGEFNFSSLPPPIISPRDGAPPRAPFPGNTTDHTSNTTNHSSNAVGNNSYTKSPSQQFMLSGGSGVGQPSLLSSTSTDNKIFHTPSRETIGSVLGTSPRSSFTVAPGTDPWSASSSHNNSHTTNNTNTNNNTLSWGDDAASLRGFEQRPRGGSFFAETTNNGGNSGSSAGLGVIGASRTSSRDQEPSLAAAALLSGFGAQTSSFSWTTNSASELDSAVSYSLMNNDVNVGAQSRFHTDTNNHHPNHNGSSNSNSNSNNHSNSSLLGGVGGGIRMGNGQSFGNQMAQHLETSRQSSSDSLLGDRLNWDGNL